MIVSHLPDYSESNPYQQLLWGGLEERGIRIHAVASDGRLLSALKTSEGGASPDVIHLHWCHEFMLGSNRLETLWKGMRLIRDLIELQIRGIRLVWTVHNLAHHEDTYRRLETMFRVILALFTDRMIVHCERAREKLLDQYVGKQFLRQKVKIVPHGSYTRYYRNDVSREESREKLGIPSDKTVFLSFGKIRGYKRVPLIIRAFKELNRSGTELVVAGKPYTEEIETRIRNLCEDLPHIRTWFEYVPEEQIQWFMNGADLTIFGFRDILVPGSVILAMSFGKPVVAPRVGCLPELLQAQEQLLFDPFEPEDLKRVLERVNKVNLSEIGKVNLRRVQRHRWADIASRTADLYRAMIGE